MNTQKSHIIWNKEIEVKYDYDIAVVGGGIAGITAACAAAKSGTSVILIERFAAIGGNATNGGVAAFCGETAGQGEIFDEIIDGLTDFDAIAPYAPYAEMEARVFNHEILAIVLQELVLKYNIKLLLHTRFADCIVSNGQIHYCMVCGKSGLEAVRAKQFIDCTGEAEVTHCAGFKTTKGRESDGLQLPMSLYFFVRHNNELKWQLPDGWYDRITCSDKLPMTSIWPNGPQSNALKIKIPMFDSTDTESMTMAEITSRRKMMQILDYYQRVEGKKWILDHCSPLIGIREGRRVIGDYVLTVSDLRAGRKFSDGIAVGTFYLDGHKPDDEGRTYILPLDELEIPPYHIPLRSLLVKDSKNLMVAGRCISADQLALSSARTMTTCAMMGQAAGITAAMAVNAKTELRNISPVEIQNAIVDRGGNLDI